MLKYIGKGTFIPGVPARDMTNEEARKYGISHLLASGLYIEIRKRGASTAGASTGEKPGPSENKLELGSEEMKED